MFDFITKSRFFGRPIELYEFVYGDSASDKYFFTDADYPIVKGSDTFLPVPISRSTSDNSGTLDKSTLEIRMQRDNPVAELFRVYPPNRALTLTIFQGEAEDTDAEWKALWTGRVLAVGWEGSEAKMACEPISTAMRRVGLRRNYQYMCPHILYGPKCGKSKTNVAVSVLGSTSRTVTVSGSLGTVDHFVGGVFEWTDTNGVHQSRTIVSATLIPGSGVLLRVNGLILGLGASATVAKGCQHTLSFCTDVHNNPHAFGGQPWIPLKNPVSNVSPY